MTRLCKLCSIPIPATEPKHILLCKPCFINKMKEKNRKCIKCGLFNIPKTKNDNIILCSNCFSTSNQCLIQFD